MLIKDYKPVLFDGAYVKGEWALERYLAKGGYKAAKKILAMPRDPVSQEVRPARPRRRRIPDRDEVELCRLQIAEAALPRGEF
jgi:hypothetical protein